MRYGRLAAAAFGATVVYYAYGFLVNGMLIAKAYAPFTAVYRPADMVMRYMPFGVIGTFIAALVLTLMFAKGYEGGAVRAEATRFGVLVGIFVACTHVVDNLVTLNIGRKLSLALAIATVVQWVLVCIAIGLIYKPAAGAR